MSTFVYPALDPKECSRIEMIEESAWATFNINSKEPSKPKKKGGGGSNNLRKKNIINLQRNYLNPTGGR